MASIATLANGTRIIQFVSLDRKRKTIRLGDETEAAAELIAVHVENLARAKRNGLAVETVTAHWIAKLDGPLADKFAKVGLLDDRLPATLGAFVQAYIDGRHDIGKRSKVNLKQARRYLVDHFGELKPMAAITEGDADGYRRWLREQVGENTCRRHCGRAKQFFRAACRKRLLDSNPFADMKNLAVGANRERDYFVPIDDARKVLEACPDSQWRLLFALSRFGGLRCPSEHLALSWGDIDWDRGTMLVRSPKTARHEGKESRVVPIFAELRPFLKAAFDEALERADQGQPLGHVITIKAIRRDRYANVRNRMAQIIERRAKLKVWPKLFQNMRATRETELAATFPQHVVCEWIGNSPRVAAKHYLRVTDADIERAVSGGAANRAAQALQNAQHSTPGPDLPQAATTNETPTVGSVWQDVAACSVPPAGLEPAT